MKTRSQKLTDKSKLVLNIILLGTLIITLSSMACAATNASAVSINEQTSSTLSIDEAKEIAAFSVVELSGAVSNLSEWKDASVEHDITFYDLEENITAYAFNIVKNNEYDGFIIISATRDKYPVLEFSKGKLPNKIPTIVKKSQSAVLDYATKNQLKIGQNIPIYGGATFYYTEYNLIDSKNAIKKKIIVDDVTSNFVYP